MEDLRGKFALVTGIANKRSIAYAIARDLAHYGARLAIAYLPTGKEAAEAKLRAMAEELGAEAVLPLDVSDEVSVRSLFQTLGERWGKLHVLIHSIAGAKREELAGAFSDTSLEGYLLAQQISAYSLIGLVREARPWLAKEGGSVVTLTYIGSVRTTPNYNVMGSAKAALESNMRYLAMELGESGIRVNAVSAGPIRTLSSSGIRDFLDLIHGAAERSALKRNVNAEEVAHAVAFLASDLASGVTGQVLYVDAGHNIFG